MIRALGITVAILLVSSPLSGQTALQLIARGDRERVALRSPRALDLYEAALEIDPNNAEALWRASNEAIDLGEFDDAKRDSLYQLGEQYARRAVQADPRSSMAHFALAKALGRRALSLAAKERVKFAGEVRKEALESLKLDSSNAGAMHVMGRWHANIMRLSGIQRFMAKNVLGGKTFNEANWRDAVSYLERAAAVEPDRIVHRLELASVYADRGNKPKAREQYQAVLQLKPLDYNDKRYQEQAERELRELR